jgi:hypothetical protein
MTIHTRSTDTEVLTRLHTVLLLATQNATRHIDLADPQHQLLFVEVRRRLPGWTERLQQPLSPPAPVPAPATTAVSDDSVELLSGTRSGSAPKVLDLGEVLQ